MKHGGNNILFQGRKHLLFCILPFDILIEIASVNVFSEQFSGIVEAKNEYYYFQCTDKCLRAVH